MNDWRTTPIMYVNRKRVRDEQGETLAAMSRHGWREWLTLVLSPRNAPFHGFVAPDGTPLFAFEMRVGSFKNWVKVTSPDGTLIARIDQIGNLFTAFKRRYTIRDASGAELGRIDNPRLGCEFVLLDGGGTCVARGIRRGESLWEVRREAPMESPWPEITAAFFVSGIGVARQGSSV